MTIIILCPNLYNIAVDTMEKYYSTVIIDAQCSYAITPELLMVS